MSIGRNIYELRKSKGLTQSALAEKLGVSEQAVSKWENGICAPDVSMFPVIAEFFGVSIDRLYGFSLNSYSDAVKKILDETDACKDTYEEIAILEEGLERYPNSPKLKTALAFSLSMVNRFSDDEKEKRDAIDRAVKLCLEVTDTCGDTAEVDDAFNMLSRIYNETGKYDLAKDAIEKISADGFSSRIVGKMQLLKNKGDLAPLSEYAEQTLWDLFWTVSHVLQFYTSGLKRAGEWKKAADFHEVHQKILSVFDSGCEDFCTAWKIFDASELAQCYMELGDREHCLASLRRFFFYGGQINRRGGKGDYRVSSRCPAYFSSTDEETLEEYMDSCKPERILPKYDGFFGDDGDYAEFKAEALGK